jgi:predicted dehydrogenase
MVYMNNKCTAPYLYTPIQLPFQTTTNMAPIKIGLIGLSTSSKATNWAVIAHLPYLQSPRGKAHYEIIALCNSSVDSAKNSITHFNLSSTIKSYGSPEDLAADPDVELVVCVVGVENHYDVLLPAIKAGKNVYTELPLASNMQQMQELVDLAEEKGVKTMFGLQGQAHPAIQLIKKMIAEDKIGKPLSTTLIATTGLPLDRPLPVAFKILAERKAGGNFATIWFLHSGSFTK